MTEKDNRKVPLIDTHCHLDMSEFDNDREDVIARAKDTGFEALITAGSDFDSAARAMELATRHDFIYAAIGVHPHDAKDFSDEIYLDLVSRSRNRKVVAIGETGLDYHYDHSPRDVQREVFRKHLRLAKEAGLPVIVHSREAKEDTMAILAESGINQGVLHCFSGDLDMAEQAMSMGLSLSLAGPVTFKKSSRLREIARIIPDDYLLIETDAPYLSPEPLRGRRNEPSYLEYTARFIADLREISLDDLARITTLNAKRLFGIGTLPDRAEIAYQIRDSLYLNITNRCTNACSFCVKFRSDFVKGHRLRLSQEPTEEEITLSIGDPSLYKEVVFCGYGEPLERLDAVKDVARWIKERGGRVRINTNGHSNLIHGRDILPELKGIVDSISVSLDAHDEATYNRLCKPAYKNAYAEIIRFIRQAKEFIPEVQATVVELEGVDIEKCREIAAQLGVKLRIRKLDVVG
ncbi:MAG: YchF/TatD family DNA exonuclease [Nitrospiraceae bacterium]|nr:YchF/TatD family DNA exonuclease [Nitrospiraceae bacterium]